MKYKHGTVGLGILSWRGHKSLRLALDSYLDRDFFALFDEGMIFLPDPDKYVRAVADEYPLRIETSPENKGIMAGMEEIANRLETDYIFFTENDNPLLENRVESKRQIEKALDLLHDDTACMARMRHIKHPGDKFTTLHKYKWMHPTPDNFVGKLRRAFRPAKARRVSGTAIYAEDYPDQRFPDSIQNVGDGFYLVDADTLPWTNQSILIKRSFFIETILPYCKENPSNRTANGFPTLEIELNRSKFWLRSGWKIACGPGLLTHERVNDRGY
ncbi:MAG: hypothetical protein HKO02_03305 [Hyphomonadaceae bacterium]|nr:hypothetical protein [Hyphomonadaceae bacterium]